MIGVTPKAFLGLVVPPKKLACPNIVLAVIDVTEGFSPGRYLPYESHASLHHRESPGKVWMREGHPMKRPPIGGDSYKPSINPARSPSMVAPLLYVGSAYAFLIAAALVLMKNGRLLAIGDYGSFAVVLVVHLFTLGFLSMTAMGVLTQWVPVVFDVAPQATRHIVRNFLLYLIAIFTFAAGLTFHQSALLAVGGILLALAISLWSIGVWQQSAVSAKAEPTLLRGLRGSLWAFNLVWLLGLFMALSFLGGWPTRGILPVHIATALVGWMGLLVLTVQQKLNPMFSMSRGQGIRFHLPIYTAATGLIVSWFSLFTSTILFRVGAGFWSLAALISMVQSFQVVRQGKKKSLDPVFFGVAASWMMLAASAVLSLWMSPLAVIVAFWGLFILIFSYQTRILPFIAAIAITRRAPAPGHPAFYLAKSLQAKHLPLFTAVIAVAGVTLAIIGRLTLRTQFEAASGVAVIVLVLMQLSAMAAAMFQARRRPVPSSR